LCSVLRRPEGRGWRFGCRCRLCALGVRAADLDSVLVVTVEMVR
jgi:hypothetical protein